jgi:hypothetical protein
MPRFFFDHVGSNEEFVDAEGLEFRDLTEATKGAQAAADDLLREACRTGVPEPWGSRYEIYDERRQLVAIVPVGPFPLH